MSLRAVKGCLLVYRGTVVRLLVCVKRVNFGSTKPLVQRVLRLPSGQYDSRCTQLCQLCRLYLILGKVSGIATADAQRTVLCVQTKCGHEADNANTVQTQRRHSADKIQTQCRQNTDTTQTQCRHNADTMQIQRRHNADTMKTQCRHNADNADTVQTQCKHNADTVQTQCRHSADTMQTVRTKCRHTSTSRHKSLQFPSLPFDSQTFSRKDVRSTLSFLTMNHFRRWIASRYSDWPYRLSDSSAMYRLSYSQPDSSTIYCLSYSLPDSSAIYRLSYSLADSSAIY
jgi:hypothetical protein